MGKAADREIGAPGTDLRTRHYKRRDRGYKKEAPKDRAPLCVTANDVSFKLREDAGLKTRRYAAAEPLMRMP